MIEKIVSESSIGSGVRRIEALAGEKALEYVEGEERELKAVSEKMRCTVWESSSKIDKLLERQTRLENEISALKRKQVMPQDNDWQGSAREIAVGKNAGGMVKFVGKVLETQDSQTLRETADQVREKMGQGIVLLAGEEGDQTVFVVSVTKECAAKGVHAGTIAKKFGEKIEGRGGGRDTFAQGGGKKRADLKDIVESFPDEIVKLFK